MQDIFYLSTLSQEKLKEYLQKEIKTTFDLSQIFEELDVFPYTAEIGYFHYYSPSRKYDFRTQDEVNCDDIWWEELVIFFQDYNIKLELLDNEDDPGMILAIGEKYNNQPEGILEEE